jgi:Flp pilus assembly protein TadB
LTSSGNGAKRRNGPGEVEVVDEVVMAVVVVVVVVVVVEVVVVVAVVAVVLVDVVVVVVLVVVGSLNLKDTATLFVRVPDALPRSFRGRQRGTLSLRM